MNIKTAALCADLSKAVYDWGTWEYYLQDKHDQYLSGRIEVRNHEAGLFLKDGTLYIAIRGTEIDSLDDIKTDLNFIPSRFPELGGMNVHSGFKKSAKAIWGQLEELLNSDFKYRKFKDVKNIVCTGHSLGGAVATLLSVYISYWKAVPVELYTFGSPKVLSNEAKEKWDENNAIHFPIEHCRFVNNNDIVPKLPLLPYWEHCGEFYYINSSGKLRLPSRTDWWSCLWDKVIGRLKGIGDFKPDGLADHSIKEYSALLNK